MAIEKTIPYEQYNVVDSKDLTVKDLKEILLDKSDDMIVIVEPSCTDNQDETVVDCVRVYKDKVAFKLV